MVGGRDNKQHPMHTRASPCVWTLTRFHASWCPPHARRHARCCRRTRSPVAADSVGVGCTAVISRLPAPAPRSARPAEIELVTTSAAAEVALRTRVRQRGRKVLQPVDRFGVVPVAAARPAAGADEEVGVVAAGALLLEVTQLAHGRSRSSAGISPHRAGDVQLNPVPAGRAGRCAACRRRRRPAGRSSDGPLNNARTPRTSPALPRDQGAGQFVVDVGSSTCGGAGPLQIGISAAI